MAGVATAAYSADALPSPGSVNGSQQQWDFAVPITQDVGGLSLLSPNSHVLWVSADGTIYYCPFSAVLIWSGEFHCFSSIQIFDSYSAWVVKTAEILMCFLNRTPPERPSLGAIPTPATTEPSETTPLTGWQCPEARHEAPSREALKTLRTGYRIGRGKEITASVELGVIPTAGETQ